MVTLGVDPGLEGAVAVLGVDGQLEALHDLPIIRDKSLAWVDGARLLSILLEATHGRIAQAFVERVSAMPGQGVSSTFTFGMGFGAVVATLQIKGLPIEFVTSARWKCDFGLGSHKRASLDRARLLFPDAELHLQKHHGRAEALLIARWGWSGRGARRQRDRLPEPADAGAVAGA